MLDNSLYSIRTQRLRAARKIASHTKLEWAEMKEFFKNTCVRCMGDSGLVNVEKDHITPLYQGGSDGIENIQPLCARCNTSKGMENFDWRPIAASKMSLVLPEYYKKK